MGAGRARTIAQLRAMVVGSSSALSAIGAHALAHGAVPDTSSLVLVVALCAGLGLIVGRVRTPPTTRSTLLTLLALIAGGQALAHLSMTAMTGEPLTHLDETMLSTHAGATLLTATLGSALESTTTSLITAIVVAIAAAVRTLLSAPAAPTPLWSVRPSRRWSVDAGRRLHDVAVTRGPPVHSQSLITPVFIAARG